MKQNNMEYKVKEALYFLEAMEENEASRNKEHFLFNYSAFTHAIRTALQYAHKYDESIYNQLVGKLIYKKLFKNIRDVNIHEEPVSTAVETASDLSASITIRGSSESLEDTEKQFQNSSGSIFYFCFPETKYKNERITMIARKHIEEIIDFIEEFNNRFQINLSS